MFRFIIYAFLVYAVYLAIKWAFRIGQRTGSMKGGDKNFKDTAKTKLNPKDIEDAEFTEVKNDKPKGD